MTLVRLLLRVITSEPGLPISVILLLPFRILKGLLMDIIQQRRGHLPRNSIHEPRRDPSTRVGLSVVINEAPTLFALPDHVPTKVRPASNNLVDFGAVLVDNALVEDDPSLGFRPLLALREDLPGSVVAEVSVGNGERHLGCIVANLVEGVGHLNDGALEHVVVPGGAVVMVVKNVVENLGLNISEVGKNLDAHDGVALRVAGVHLGDVVLRLVGDGPVVNVVAESDETLELGLSG